MIKSLFFLLNVFLLPVTLPAVVVQQGEGAVQNGQLAVRYDTAARTFQLTDLASGKVFVKNGVLDGAGAIVREEAVRDAVFGEGRRIVVARAEGGNTALELYAEVPFVFIRPVVQNDTAAEIDVAKQVTAEFSLDLGKPAAALRTVGTGGLLAPNKNPGSYLFLTVAEPESRNGVVVGWANQERGSGVVFSSVKNDTVVLKAESQQGHLRLAPGKSSELDTLVIGYFPDARLGNEFYAEVVARWNKITLRPQSAVYCTWYAEKNGRAGTDASSRELAKFIAENLKDFGMDTLQIDDHWQDGRATGGPASQFDRVNPKGPYPKGIAPTAEAVSATGVRFGIWWLPFGRHHMEDVYKDKQDWFVKRENGEPFRTAKFGGTCLDSTHPGVQQHLFSLAKTMREWGATYYKMDGLWTGTGTDIVYINDGYKDDKMGNCLPLYDRTKTNIEALRIGLRKIREGAGDDVFFSGCCVSQNMRSFGGSIGLVDSMRIGPDYNHDGKGVQTGPLRGSRLYFMNGKIWWNDPDPVKVRTSNAQSSGDRSIRGGVSLDHARLATSWVAHAGQFFLISDWLPDLSAERLEVLRRTMASHGKGVRPVDYFDRQLPAVWILSDTSRPVRRDVLALYNWEKKPGNVRADFARAGLVADKPYHAFDFWANKPLANVTNVIESNLPPESCQIVALRLVTNHPVLVSTSRHITQGVIDVHEEVWKDGSLTGVSEVIRNDPYELRIAGVGNGTGWEFAHASVSAADTAAGVSIEKLDSEPGWLRLRISGNGATRAVQWQVSFSRK